MQYRTLGRTGWNVSAISFGAWAIGGTWGKVEDSESLAALHKAIDLGVNFIDTADVYGDGRSERLIGQVLKDRTEEIIIATKAGRRLDPHTAAGYNRENLVAFIERSLKNLDVETLDLVQLHSCEITVLERGGVIQALLDAKRAGKTRFIGYSGDNKAAEWAITSGYFDTLQTSFNRNLIDKLGRANNQTAFATAQA